MKIQGQNLFKIFQFCFVALYLHLEDVFIQSDLHYTIHCFKYRKAFALFLHCIFILSKENVFVCQCKNHYGLLWDFEWCLACCYAVARVLVWSKEAFLKLRMSKMRRVLAHLSLIRCIMYLFKSVITSIDNNWVLTCNILDEILVRGRGWSAIYITQAMYFVLSEYLFCSDNYLTRQFLLPWGFSFLSVKTL